MEATDKEKHLSYSIAKNTKTSSIFGFTLGGRAEGVKRSGKTTSKIGGETTFKTSAARKFKEADVTKAVRGAQKAGLNVREVQIAFDGKIAILTGDERVALTSLDQWRATRANKA